MTDVISARGAASETAIAPALKADDGRPAYDLIELLFFAYRDFVRDADAALAAYGFGRAHHRVLHFVDRNPGLRVTELLDILKITKQSLGRVLRELIDQGFILQREGEADRRQRLLYVTERGDRLALELAQLQTKRVARALGGCEAATAEAAKRFLFAMVDPEERDAVERLTADARSPGGRA
jgi:DNA-binding MarR family transcriptional regulator